MKKNKIILIAVFLLLNFLCNSDSLKISGKYIKLEVNEKDGRFILFGKNDLNQEWVPLLFEDYPYTSFFRIFADKQDIFFGDQGSKRNSEIKFDNNKILYYWENDKLRIELTYQIISSGASKYADTLIIDMNIRNISISKVIVDYFFIIDTYLGEKSNNHFYLNKDALKSEKEIINPNENLIIRSENKDLKLALNVFFNQDNQIKANRIFFANWKRVEQNIGVFNCFDKRSFDLEPYSKNDSSAVIEYNDIKIGMHNEKKFRFVLSMQNNIVSLNENEKNENENLNVQKEDDNKNLEKTNDKEIKDTDIKNNSDKKELDLINMNLDDLLRLLDAINKKLESGQKLSDEDINLVNRILEEVKKRRNVK